MTLAAAILDAALREGGRAAFVRDGKPDITYATLDRETGRLAARLRATGAMPGDRIVVQAEKSVAGVLLYIAALRAGLIYVPLNTAYTATEVAAFVADVEPAIFVCDPANAAAAPPVRTVLTLDADGEGTLFADLPATPLPVEPRTSDDIAAICFTSGTTGRSKGAMLSHGNLLSNARTLIDLWRFSERDVLLHVLPIYHVHGLFVALHCALLSGATVLWRESFDPKATLADLEDATVMMGVPTHYTRLLSAMGDAPRRFPNMRLFISGSAPLLAETHRQFEAATGQRILERYGMTETGMITSNPYDGERVAGTVGFPLSGVEVRVANDKGREVARGGTGILEVRGPNVFKGYWRMPEKTAEEFRADGFFITGDMAEQAPDGRVTLVGRAKDLIISGGLNIYPKEIELLIDAVSGVDESAVIGVPHPDFGETVVAVVAGKGVDEAAVMAALDGQLARFKQPKHVVIVEALPRNAMGKVQKAVLRARYAGLFST
jgi:malonyl-CoA/methylmalonyl-CoA synthetase